MKSAWYFLLCIACLCASGAIADGQPVFTSADDIGQPLRFGIKAGINIANAANHPLKTNARTTFSVGAVLNYRQNRYLSWQIEAMVIDKGYSLPEFNIDSVDVTVGTARASISVIYLEFPVLAKLRLPLMGYVRPYLTGGGYVGFSISDRLTLADIAQAYEYKISDRRAVETGLIFGGGVDIKAGETTIIFVEIRYEPALTTIITTADQKHRVISFQAGWLF